MSQLSFIVFHKSTFNSISCWFSVVCLLVFSNIAFAEFSKEKSLEVSLFKEQGEKSFQQGNFENAIIQWAGLAQEYEKQHDITKHREILIKLASAYHALGQYSTSIDILNRANKLVENSQQKIIIMNSLGTTYLAMGKRLKANKLFQESADVARKENELDLLVASLNKLGNLKLIDGKFNQALEAYSESIKLAQITGNKKLTGQSLANAAVAAFEVESKDNINTRLEKAIVYLRDIKDDSSKAFSLIALGRVAKGLVFSELSDKVDWGAFAYKAFTQAERVGKHISDVRVTSYAKGHLGKMHHERKEYGVALYLTQQAIFLIEKIQAPEILYQWQGQIGRILKAKGDNETAILAYQQAVETLKSICPDLSAQQSNIPSFQEEIRPIYLELADLLLQANDTLEAGKKYQQNLLEVRNVIEQLKVAELQDYFKGDCDSASKQKIKALDTVESHTAIIYPLLFSDRTEVLLSVSSGLKRFTVPVNRETMINEIRAFRQKLENRTTQEYQPHAKKLYQWLMAPLQETLIDNNINTLVMVSDEFLRTIPMAALHDGKTFLIEKYAIANTPGLNIIDSKSIVADNTEMLAMGLTESIQGFSVLPYVSKELANINKIFKGKVLQDKDFLLDRVQNELKQTPYSIVHIASHGLFNTDSQKNFVLTFDDKLNIDGLEKLIGLSQFRKNPVELLTLSASHTAAGDDLAAVGLTGLAIKTGARSAVATLWVINDQAATTLVTEFYRQLKTGAITKAEAIKKAQVHLIKKTPHRHPYFWSPFLLIGNWL